MKLSRWHRARQGALVLVVLVLAAGLLSAPAQARRGRHARPPRPELFRQKPAATGPSTPSQPGFEETTVISGLDTPTAVRFSPDGRVFVAEKSGIIDVFDSLSDTTPTIFADLSTNVYNFFDRGLLGMALDPNFPANPYVYVLYTYDGDIGGPAPKWGTPGVLSDPCPTPPGATTDGCVASARLSRLQASGDQMVGSEQVLVSGWCQQFPSHSIGDLAFAPDGSLWASGGDAASFNFADYGQAGAPLNPCGDPPGGVGGVETPPTAEGGALRSQDDRTSNDPAGLNGTIIRVDPATGAPLSDNPNFGNPDLNVARTVAYGLRNAFRFTFRPGTAELWLGDVGWNTYEEIDVLASSGAPVENFGWPCYEGAPRQPGYDALDLNICEQLYAQPGAVTGPVFQYAQTDHVVPGETCPTGSSDTSGLAFYEGGSYPAAYDGALFMADYARGCIWAMMPGANGLPDPSNIIPFAEDVNPVDLQTGPGGDLFYVNINQGQIRRFSYFSGNQPPTAIAQASPTFGPLPLAVSFDGTASSDPEKGALTYEWDLDADGQFDDSTSATPTHTYTAAGPVLVRLRVTDPGGASAIDSVTITAGDTPPQATIVTPTPGTTYRVGQTIDFSGSATDQQDGTLPPSALSWSLIVHHCPSTCHTHTIQDFVGTAAGSFAAPDYEYPSYLELQLTATDSAGLKDIVSLQLDPQTTTLSFDSSPQGLQIAIGSSSSATPFTRTVILGSSNSISAISPQTLGGNTYQFVSWSDGGAQSHNIVANGSATYTANYQQIAVTTITVSDSGIVPSKIDVPLGTTILWSNVGQSSHRVLDSSGMGLFDSGTIPAGGSYAFKFVGAGTYSYSDPGLRRGRASIGVGMTASPGSGSTSTQFTIRWASGSPPPGYVFDVTIQRPNQATVNWQIGVTSLSALFTPDAGTGRYGFQARLRNTSNGAVSGWSRAIQIRVR